MTSSDRRRGWRAAVVTRSGSWGWARYGRARSSWAWLTPNRIRTSRSGVKGPGVEAGVSTEQRER